MDYFELIEDYKKDELPVEQKSEFDIEMQKNEALRKAVKHHDVVMAAMDVLMEDDIRQQVEKVRAGHAKPEIKEIHSNDETDASDDFKIEINTNAAKQARGGYQMAAFNGDGSDVGGATAEKGNQSAKVMAIPRRIFYTYAAAAAVLALAVVTITINNDLGPSTPEQIFAAHFEPYENQELTRGSTDEKQIRSSAYTAYDLKNFEEAIEIFGALTPGYKEEMDDAFYIGISRMELGRWESAVDILEKVVDSDSEYKIEASWYLGLSYLRMGDRDQASMIFRSFRDAGKYKSEESGKVLEEMKR